MRKRFAIAAVVALAVALLLPPGSAAARGSQDAYEKPRVGGVYARGFAGPGSYAVLIDVHAVHKAPAPPSGANCSNDGSASGTYATTGWVIASNRTAHLNTATVPSYLGNVTTALQSGWNAWRVDAGVPSVSVATDGTVTKYTANRLYDILWGKTGGSLATTYTWRWSDGFIESDVVFNNSYTWWQAPSEGDGCYEDAGNVYDVGNIATHEFGHAYGLGHPSGARFETMYAYGYSGETLKRSPATGDRAGISALY